MTWNSLDGTEIITCEANELRDLVKADPSNENQLNSNLKYYRCVCPRCLERNKKKGDRNYDKKNLSINKDFNYGRCFRCNAIFLDPLLGGLSEVDTQIEVAEEDTAEFKVKGVNTAPYQSAEDLPYTPEGCEYIQKRNRYYNCNLNQFCLRYTQNKIIIPYFDPSGNIFYYQFRYIDVNKSPTKSKYFNPTIDNKPIYIAPDSCKKPVWKMDKPTIIVEGAMTAIALKITVGDNVNVLALMGKVPTNYQINFIKWLGLTENIYVMMDDEPLSEVVYREFRRQKIPSSIIETAGFDAEELLSQLGIDMYRAQLQAQMNLNKKNLTRLSIGSIYSFNRGAELLKVPVDLRIKI